MSSKKDHVCVLCSSKLESKDALKEHFRRHANKEIDIRGREINVSPSVDSTDKDADSFGIPCDICSEVSENISLAIQHNFRRHPDNPSRHFCSYCGKQFPLKVNRDQHLLLQHKDAKKTAAAPCYDCGAEFYNHEALNYHQKSAHKRVVSILGPILTAPPSKKIKMNNAGEAQSVYFCHLCGADYIVKFNLRKHLEKHHSSEERNKYPEDMIKCIACDALFYNQKAYENHNLSHRPDDLYVTSEEQRLQTVTRVDQDFDIRRVQTTFEKYLPIDRPKCKPVYQKNVKPLSSKTSQEFRSLSPNSSDSSSDTDSDDIPLARRINRKS